MVSLLAGLLLPWWTGFALVSRFEPGGSAARRMRQVGLGFFAGYALLCPLLYLDAQLFGVVSWSVVALVLALIALAALLLPGRRVPVQAEEPALERPVIVAVLLAWIALHLVLNWVEVLAIPVYPWDAWAAWVYRAKAWFAHSTLFPFLTPEQWLLDTSTTAYSAIALDYPWLVSLAAFWTALSLGEWHETLVGLPVALLGLALTMAFYGQLRSHGLRTLPSLAITGMLVSTPLVAVHLSLAGYADIWLAGFAGLGFIALLRYLMEGNLRQGVLGLVLLLVGTQVKLEGMVWLLTGLALLLVCKVRARWLVSFAGALALAVLVLWLGAGGWISLPGGAVFGWRDGALHLPGLGRLVPAVNDLRWAYFDNAFRLASWHLVWLFALVVAAVSARRWRRSRQALAFLSLVALVQVVVFVFSSQGEWAQDYTAINRLPLQVYPAVLFALASCWRQLMTVGSRVRPDLRQVAVVMLACALVVGVATLWFARAGSAAPGSEPLDVGPGHLRFVSGRGSEVAGGLRVEDFDNGVALLSTGPIRVEASALYLLRVDLEYDWNVPWPEGAPAFFWRRADQPDVVSRRTLLDEQLFDLDDSEDWKGEIIEAGFVVFENKGQPLLLHSARLSGPAPDTLLQVLPQEWFGLEAWSQRSANFVVGGKLGQHVPPNLVIVSWAALSMLVLVPLSRRRNWNLGACLTLVAVITWGVADARWLGNRLRQSAVSWHALANMDVEQRISADEAGLFHDWLREVEARYLRERPFARILLVGNPDLHRFYWRRAKYDLLPHSVTVVRELPPPGLLGGVDFVLYLGDFLPATADDAQRADPAVRLGALDIPAPVRGMLEPLRIDPQGTLLRVHGAPR